MIPIFVGATLYGTHTHHSWAQYCPPASQGDIYRAARSRPKAIGLIDGVFDGAPSVWHKEILWALSRGIHVLGAASMGALRASELGAFGMIGIGAIFEQYRDRSLLDDDEVAILHADQEFKFRPLTDAMVDIRRWISDAVRTRVISEQTAQCVLAEAKGRHYKERHIHNILSTASRSGAPGSEVRALSAYIAERGVSQKQEDALAMLSYIEDNLEILERPHEPSFVFQATTMWQTFVSDIEASVGTSTTATPNRQASAAVTLEDVLDEIRIWLNAFDEIQVRSTLRYMAIAESTRIGSQMDDGALAKVIERFRVRRSLRDLPSFSDWMVRNDLSERDALVKFFRHQWQLESAIETFSATSQTLVVEELKASDLYQRCRDRAEAKRAFLLARPDLLLGEPDSELAVQWLSVTRDDAAVLSAEYFAAAGFQSREHFTVAVIKEYHFARSLRQNES